MIMVIIDANKADAALKAIENAFLDSLEIGPLGWSISSGEDLVADATDYVATNIALDTISAATMGSDSQKPKGFL